MSNTLFPLSVDQNLNIAWLFGLGEFACVWLCVSHILIPYPFSIVIVIQSHVIQSSVCCCVCKIVNQFKRTDSAIYAKRGRERAVVWWWLMWWLPDFWWLIWYHWRQRRRQSGRKRGKECVCGKNSLFPLPVPVHQQYFTPKLDFPLLCGSPPILCVWFPLFLHPATDPDRDVPVVRWIFSEVRDATSVFGGFVVSPPAPPANPSFIPCP